MRSDDTRFSIPAVWSPLYAALKGTQWDDADIDDAIYKKNHEASAAAHALRSVYLMEWKGVSAEDGVLATLKAARRLHGTTYLTTGQVKEMGCHFTAYYDDFEEPMDDYLRENLDPVRWNWLNPYGQRQIVKAVVKDTEIWINRDDRLPGVWVFSVPGRV